MVRPPDPVIPPEKVVELLSPPAVRLPAPRLRAPAPASDWMVWLKPFRSSVAPEAMVKAELDEKPPTAPARSVPAATLVGP